MSTNKSSRNRSRSISDRSRKKSVSSKNKHVVPSIRLHSPEQTKDNGRTSEKPKPETSSIAENDYMYNDNRDDDNCKPSNFDDYPSDKLRLTEQWVATTIQTLNSAPEVYRDLSSADDNTANNLTSEQIQSPNSGKQLSTRSKRRKKRSRRRASQLSQGSRDSLVSDNESVSTYRKLGLEVDENTMNVVTSSDGLIQNQNPSRDKTTKLQRSPIENPNLSKPLLPFLTFTPAASNLEEAEGNNILYEARQLPTSTFDKTRRGNVKVTERISGKAGSDDKNDVKSDTLVEGESSRTEKSVPGYDTDIPGLPTSQGSEEYLNTYFRGNRQRKKGTRGSNNNNSVLFYLKVCEKLGVLPIRAVIHQFGKSHLSFKNLTLTTRDMKALCLALQKETFASSLDFTGNFINSREIEYIITVLNRLHTVFQVSLCNNCLNGQGLISISQFLLTNDFLTRLNLSGNKLNDQDAPFITSILKNNSTLKTLLLNHNEFREEGGRSIGQALGDNTTLEDLDLSWNHLRRCGAIGIAKGLQKNTALRTVNLAWNGFGFEGCVAIGDMLCQNYTITELDLAYNRISPPAVLELLRGIAGNKTLRILKIGYNPITASFSSLILAVVKKHQESALENIDLAGVVVDKEFVSLLEEIQRDRFFIVNYEVSLPVKKMSREEMREKIGLPSAYNVDPLRMLYLLKEKMRASDFFYKINKDHDDGLQRDELYALFDEAGIPVTGSVIDKIMEFMDTNGDGTIDLGEFLQGDKRIKIMSRRQLKDEQSRQAKDESYTKYSRTFQKAHIDPITLALKVDHNTTPMRQPRRLSVARSINDSEPEDNNHLKLP